MDNMMERTRYVYFLRDPRDKAVRYVGVTDNPKARMNLHWSSRNGGNPSPRDLWMRELDSLGTKPFMDLVLGGLNWYQARRAEAFIVRSFNERHPGQLFQKHANVFNCVEAFQKIWSKANIREKQLIQRFINRDSLPCS